MATGVQVVKRELHLAQPEASSGCYQAPAGGRQRSQSADVLQPSTVANYWSSYSLSVSGLDHFHTSSAAELVSSLQQLREVGKSLSSLSCLGFYLCVIDLEGKTSRSLEHWSVMGRSEAVPGAFSRQDGARGSPLQLDGADGSGAEALPLWPSAAIWNSYWSGEGFERNAGKYSTIRRRGTEGAALFC